jgi:phage terminase Nu1 subunit (DNA packaging protein)
MTETAPAPTTLRGDALWGAKAIAAFLDCSMDKVHSLKETGAPISKIGGQLFALRSALMKWLQRQAA